jgi:hypothetical protein
VVETPLLHVSCISSHLNMDFCRILVWISHCCPAK